MCYGVVCELTAGLAASSKLRESLPSPTYHTHTQSHTQSHTHRLRAVGCIGVVCEPTAALAGSSKLRESMAMGREGAAMAVCKGGCTKYGKIGREAEGGRGLIGDSSVSRQC